MMKKFLSLLCALVILCGLCCTAMADQSQASRLGNRAIGMTGTITQNANVRAQADENTALAGRLSEGDEVMVYGVVRNERSGNRWYLVEWQYGWYGWISASVIDLMEYSKTDLDNGYVIIKNDGTRARSGAGTEYSQVAICVAGNGFYVMDMEYGSNGKIWYNISIDGISCWISSGVADYYPY